MWSKIGDDAKLLRFIQPALLGLIDGSISTLAPMFAAAYAAGAKAAFLVGLAAAIGAGISMGISEGLSDDGKVTNRGTSLARGMITGGATFIGGAFHALPFLLNDFQTALILAYSFVTVELIVIALIRKRFMQVSLSSSLINVTLAGIIVTIVGIFLGQQ